MQFTQVGLNVQGGQTCSKLGRNAHSNERVVVAGGKVVHVPNNLCFELGKQQTQWNLNAMQIPRSSSTMQIDSILIHLSIKLYDHIL
jgi:hypothetical protein